MAEDDCYIVAFPFRQEHLLFAWKSEETALRKLLSMTFHYTIVKSQDRLIQFLESLKTRRNTVVKGLVETATAGQGTSEELRWEGTDRPMISEKEEERPARQLARSFSAQPGRTNLPSRKFSVFVRRNTSDPTSHTAFTNAWLSTSNFQLNDEEDPSIFELPAITIQEEAEMEVVHKPLERQGSLGSLESSSSPVDDPRSAEELWIHSSKAKSSMLTALTAFYCLFIVIFALVLELSHLLSGETERKFNTKDMIFGIYMYGIGISFFVYMYVVLLLNPRWYSTVASFRSLLKCFPSSASEESISSAAATVRRVTHTSPSAGSLFLRLGAIVFGVVGIVYYAFLVFLCTIDSKCSSLSIALDSCAIIFIFTQMHFIFFDHYGISFHRPIRNHASSGREFMDVDSLCADGRGCYGKGTQVSQKSCVGQPRQITSDILEGEVFSHRNSTPTSSSSHEESENHAADSSCSAASCMFSGLSDAMYTAIVEYSLIAAAVMYIVWRNIGRVDRGAVYTKRKHQIRVDCSKTTTGLFLGLAFLAATFTSMIVYYGFSMLKQQKNAAFVYALTDIFQYICSTLGCVCAIYQMRSLRYNEKHDEKNDQELLDQMLLALGLVGELIYSVAGLVGLTGDAKWQPLTFLLLFVHIFRLFQVGFQTFLLFVATRVRVRSSDMDSQPGKQAITFLLAANLAIFLMNLFESEKAGVSEIIVDFYGKRSWVFLVRSFSPLTIFYRFHSSVCFAEIWKNVYAKKRA